MSTSAAPSDPVPAPPSSSSASAHPPPKPYLSSSSSSSPSPSPHRPSPTPLLSLRNPSSSPSPPPPPPPPPQQLYPVAVASAPHHRGGGGGVVGFGFPPKPSARAAAAAPPPPHPSAAVDQSVTVANPAGYIPNASPTAVMNLPAAAQARPFVYGGPDHPAGAAAMAARPMRPPPMQAQQPLPPLAVARPVGAAVGGGGHGSGVSVAVPPKGIPIANHPKAPPLPTVSSTHDYGNSKERDRSGEDTVMTINSRKVRVLDTEPRSLYSLCRSWVRNGVQHESQPNFGNSEPLLPKPLPASIINTSVLRDDENADKDEETNKEHVGSAEELSARDLLKEHIKRGKKIRARLRKERRLRIERYKDRLTLLLPPPPETGRHESA